jgi:aminoglycoside phosphotransferase (APT) family kinase protein
MSEMPSQTVLGWAAKAIGAGVRAADVKSLHGGSSPWLLHVESEGDIHQAVLRVVGGGRIFPFQIATGAAGLRVAATHGLAAPRLIASDLDGRVTGTPATLETTVPGSSASPPRVSTERLRAAGAAIAKVHKVPLAPQPNLPSKVRSLQPPIHDDEVAMVRRWASLYRSSSDHEKPAVVDAFCELTGLPASRAHRLIRSTHSTPLLQLADDVLREHGTPQGETVFVHADLHPGNMMWDGDTNVVLIDWKDAGVGDPGVDLGHLRMQMALWYGEDAPGHVLEGWQRESGREATDVPYWDAVAAVHTPTELEDWGPFGFDEQGKPLASGERTGRRDAFLRAALDQLTHNRPSYEWFG